MPSGPNSGSALGLIEEDGTLGLVSAQQHAFEFAIVEVLCVRLPHRHTVPLPKSKMTASLYFVTNWQLTINS